MYGKGAVGQIGSTPLVNQIRQARQNPRVKAIVLRITVVAAAPLPRN
jgi:ClpP class serine protease